MNGGTAIEPQLAAFSDLGPDDMKLLIFVCVLLGAVSWIGVNLGIGMMRRRTRAKANRDADRNLITPIVDRIGFNTAGATDGKSVVMRWDEVESIVLTDMTTTDGSSHLFLMLTAGAKTVIIRDTAQGWVAFLDRLKQLPGADPEGMDGSRTLAEMRNGFKFTLWKKEEQSSGQTVFAMAGSRNKPVLASYLSQTLIRWLPAERAFELARFDGEIANVTETLRAPFESLDGFRIWRRGWVAARAWSDGNDQRFRAEAPTDGYYGLQIWTRDPKWTSFRVDLAHQVAGEEMETIIANLLDEWRERLAEALPDRPKGGQ